MSAKKWLGLGIKLSLTIGLFWLILRGCDWDNIRTRLAALKPIILVGILLIIGVQCLLLTLRWRWITLAMGHDLSFRQGFQGQLISQFFNQGLPSSIGGDGVRVWWLTRIRMPLGQALENVLFDRLAGFFSLLLMVAGSMCLLVGMTQDRASLWTLALLTGGGLAGFFALVMPWRLGLTRKLQGSNRLLGRFACKVVGFLGEFRRLLLLVTRSPRDLARILGSSISIHLLSVVLGFFIAVNLDVPVSFVQCLAVMLPALLIAYLPLSIAGWGVREGALVVAFGLIGLPAVDAVVVSVTLGLGYLVVALAGGVIWLLGGLNRFMVEAVRA